MRDMAGKIAELKFEAPLARFEEEDTASLKNMNLLTGARKPPVRIAPFRGPWRTLRISSRTDPRNLLPIEGLSRYSIFDHNRIPLIDHSRSHAKPRVNRRNDHCRHGILSRPLSLLHAERNRSLKPLRKWVILLTK